MPDPALDPEQYVETIRASGLSIYDLIEVGHPELWISSPQLQVLLDNGLRGLLLQGLPLRTRSKVVKERICKVLGYPVPKVFRRTHPRFPGQMFDVYVQKSNNLQVWNEDLSSTRRYVLVRVADAGSVEKVRVVTGDVLSLLDTTGKLTQKYQARFAPGRLVAELVSATDTPFLRRFVSDDANLKVVASPTHPPKAGELFSIRVIFERLSSLIGQAFEDSGYDQERNRGGSLHALACRALGYQRHQDDGQFPDIRQQLVEVKLQTSPTIDLGLVRPNSEEPLDVPQISQEQVRHCDVRYAVFYGKTDGRRVTVTHLSLTTGADFFSRFPQFGGKVLNKKLQIPLPRDFFER